MNSSGSNRPVISSYTFGPPVGEGPKLRPTLTGAWVVLPGLAAFGAASVAAISLSPASSDSTHIGARARSGTVLAGLKADRSQVKVGQPILQVVTAIEPSTPDLAMEDGSQAAAISQIGKEERPAIAAAPAARAVTGSIPKIDGVGTPDAPEQTFADLKEVTTSAEVVQGSASSANCETGCDSYSAALSDIHQDDASLQVEPVVTDLLAVAEGQTVTVEEVALLPQQAVFPGVVDVRPVPGAPADLFASEGFAGKAESSAAVGRSVLELTPAEMLAAPDEDETNTDLASKPALRTVDGATGSQNAASRSAAVREHLARIDAKYAKNTVAGSAAANVAVAGEAGLSADYDEVQVVSAAGLTPLGSSSVIIAEDQLVSVRLGDLISLFQDKLEKPLFVWMSTSSASTRFVTPDTLAAAGLDVQFDPEHRQIVLGMSD